MTHTGTSPAHSPQAVDELSGADEPTGEDTGADTGAQIGEQIGGGAAGGEVDEWAEMVAYLAEVGDRVRLQRAGRGWSQPQLAAATGLSSNKVAYIESGDPNLTVLRLHDFAVTFGCSTADLLPDCGPPRDVDTGGPLPALPAGADDPASDDPAGEGRLREEVARRARSQRSYLRLSQDDVAAAAGLTRNFVSATERGVQHTLDAYRLLRLARALDTALGWLLNDPHYHRSVTPAQHPATPLNPPREQR